MSRDRRSRRPRRTHRTPAGDTKTRYARALGVSTRKLGTATVKELTKAQRAVLVGERPVLVKVGTHLTPSYPRKDGASLAFFSPMAVECGPVSWSGSASKDGYALFSSKYWSVSQPTVQVRFDLTEPGKKHLVELYLTCLQKTAEYTFRIIPDPSGQWRDEVFQGNKTVITEVIDPPSGYTGPFSVTFTQKNAKADLRSWYFHKVVITPVG